MSSLDDHRLTLWRRFGDPAFKTAARGPSLLGWDPSGAILHLQTTFGAEVPRVESWDVRTGERLPPTVLTRGAPVTGLAIDAVCSPIVRDGNGSAEPCTEVWNLRAGTLLATLPIDSRGAPLLTSADGRLAVHCRPSSLDVYALPGGETVGSWSAFSPVAVSPDGALIVWRLGSPDRLIVSRLDGKPVATLGLRDEDLPTAVVFSRDGRRVFAGGTGARFACWDVTTGDLLWHVSSPRDHSDDVAVVARSADGETFFAVERGYRLCAISAAGETRWRTSVSNHFGTSAGDIQILPSPDGARVAVSVLGGLTRIVDAATGADRTPVEGHRGRLVALAISPDGRLAASGDDEGEVRVYDLARGDTLWTLEVADRGFGVSSLEFSRDGRSLWTTGNGWVQRWSLATGFEESRRHHSFRQVGPRVVGARDGARTLVVDPLIELWSDRAATPVQWAWNGGGASYEAAFSDAEGRVAVAFHEEPDDEEPEVEEDAWTFVTFDAETGRDVAREWVPGRLLGLRPTDDGPLSIGRLGEWLVVREAYGARREVAVREASDDVGEVAVSADGRWMALADRGVVEVWSLGPTGRCVGRVRPAEDFDRVARLALSHDGGMVVVATACGVVAVYERTEGDG